MNDLEKDAELSYIGLFFTIVAFIFFCYMMYKITNSLILGLIVGSLIAIRAVSPAYDQIKAPYGKKEFLWRKG